jgi:uncharacterized protein
MKNSLVAFAIPILGLKQSHYTFDLQLDASFFKNFEASEIAEADITVAVELERKTGHLEFSFDFWGTIKTECDRCTASIDLPIEGYEKLIAKFSEATQEDEDEIIYIHPETPILNIAQYLYEYITLAVPVSKIYDCENDEVRPCDMKVLNFLATNEAAAKAKESEAAREENNANTWAALQNWNKEN